MKLNGDRRDAKRVKDLTGMAQILIDLKPKRCDSDVYLNQKFDVTKLVEFVEKNKKEGNDITYFHAFVAALGKVMYNRPKLNRFVANRHVYEHNELIISFVAKISFDDKSEEMMLMVPIKENDNILTLSKKIREMVDNIRKKKSIKKEGANSAIDILGKLPNIIRVPIVGILKWMDARDMLPSDLIKDNLYYSSLIVSNLGAIKCGAIYHNITNFGTASGLATMGEIKDELVILDGKKEVRKLVEFGVNLDERIADGYYMAKALQLLQYFFNNPELLNDNIGAEFTVPENR